MQLAAAGRIAAIRGQKVTCIEDGTHRVLVGPTTAVEEVAARAGARTW